MIKIIDLDIEGTITGDTKVTEIALVEMPAIEQNFIYFTKEQFVDTIKDYPQYLTDNAKEAKAWVDENGYGSCMTPVGKARLNQLAKGEPISLETMKRMKAYADRHKVDLESSKSFDDGCGMLAWYSWGLDETGRVEKWLESKIGKLEQMDYQPSLPAYANYPVGDKTKCKDPAKNGGVDCSNPDMLVEPVLFVKRNPGEDRSDYINRCTEYLIKNEGKQPDQAYAICNSEADNFSVGQKVSFDYDDTLSTTRGKGLALHEIQSGSEVYIISARHIKEGMYKTADELGIPHNRVYATGSNKAKIQKIKDLHITKHYDNNNDVINQLGRIGVDFNCPCLDEFVVELEPLVVTTYTPENAIFNRKQGFTMIGFVDGEPVFTSPEEAELYGQEQHGCSGHHTHTDENGNVVYMGCEVHPEKMLDIVSDNVDILSVGEENIQLFSHYSDEEKEVVKMLKFLKDNDYEQFEAVVGAMRGATETEIKKRNHKNPTNYFKYERVLSGAPDRDFCMSIENRYFRRVEIDLLRDTNTEFGHERQPYSKWLYKGGPNCVHAWRKYLAQGNVIADQGMADGTAGMAPKTLPNNGYYSPETKRKSEVAYIISQQNMSNQEFSVDNEKRMVYSPLMIPNILIPRLDEDTNEKYFVKFTPSVIEKIQNLYMIEKRLDQTNYEHTDKKIESVVMVESWLVSGESDKAYQLGFSRSDIPDGTWMGGFKVLDTPEGDNIWNNYIKTGKVKGFSVEGNFLMNFSRLKTDEYLLDEIINIIKQITD
jgi:hypothetical protein